MALHSEIHSLTHIYLGHQFPPSTMIHGIFPVQSTCLTGFLHNLSLSPLCSTSGSSTLRFILQTFLHPVIIFFLQHMPYCNLFFCSTEIVISSQSLSHLFFIWNYLNVTHSSDHSHLCPLKCHLIFFPYRPRLTSMQHTTSHTTAAQSPSHNQ